MKTTDLRRLATCLEKDSYNSRIVGSRYNRGIIPTLAEIKRNTRYDYFIVKRWPRFNKLVSY